ncbi:hypothetical protein FXO38_14192 [Capsicum annuum]|nr:hypothetical protein FXO37_33958 [Capsicum annuum]KAF3656351.1 hypothetical protein FXO38_14192 [Capsicum annuum]
MLEKFLIFTRRGLILWTCKDLENALRGSPIDTLIRSCLLEECSSVASYNYDIPGAAYTLKWTFHNKLGPAKVVPDEYNERTYCEYGMDVSTDYGLGAFGLLLISQTLVNSITKCLCFGRGMMGGSSTTHAIFFFVFSCFNAKRENDAAEARSLWMTCLL